MGTHPIFESDFDCLTVMDLCRNKKSEIFGLYDRSDFIRLTIDELVETGELVTLNKLCVELKITAEAARTEMKKYKKENADKLTVLRRLTGIRDSVIHVVLVRAEHSSTQSASFSKILSNRLYGFSKDRVLEGAINTYQFLPMKIIFCERQPQFCPKSRCFLDDTMSKEFEDLCVEVHNSFLSHKKTCRKPPQIIQATEDFDYSALTSSNSDCESIQMDYSD